MNAEKTLKAMSNNKRDWCMKDLLCVARNLGIPYSNNGTSHYVFRYQGLIDNVSIPDHHDIHPDYITKFLKFVKRVNSVQEEHKEK